MRRKDRSRTPVCTGNDAGSVRRCSGRCSRAKSWRPRWRPGRVRRLRPAPGLFPPRGSPWSTRSRPRRRCGVLPRRYVCGSTRRWYRRVSQDRRWSGFFQGRRSQSRRFVCPCCHPSIDVRRRGGDCVLVSAASRAAWLRRSAERKRRPINITRVCRFSSCFFPRPETM